MIGPGIALVPAASAAPITTTPSEWVNIAPKAVTTVGSAVHGNRALVVTEPKSAVRSGVARQAVLLQRTTRATRRTVRALPATIGPVRRVVSDSTGRWLVLHEPVNAEGYLTGQHAVTRLRADGAVDTGFGDAGRAVLTGSWDFLVSDSTGRPVVVAQDMAGTGETRSIRVARLTRAGQPDPTFATQGVLTIAPPDLTAIAATFRPASGLAVMMPVESVAIARNNGIVLAGELTDQSAWSTTFLLRVSSSGEVDRAFGIDGMVTYGTRRSAPNAVLFQAARQVAVNPALGDIYTVGRPAKNTRDVVWKRTSRGAANVGFGNGGSLLTSPSEALRHAAATCTGGIVQTTHRRIRVITPSGKHDLRYGTRGQIVVPAGSPLGQIQVAAVDTRPCATNYLAASPRVRAGRGGITIVWLTLPRR